MSPTAVTLELSEEETREFLNVLLDLLVVLNDPRFPILEPAQEILSDWLVAKYRGNRTRARRAVNTTWKIIRCLLEQIDDRTPPDELSCDEALERVYKKYKRE